MENPKETVTPEAEQPEQYVPRPAWQAWAARVALALFLIFVIYQILSIARGGL